MPMAAVFAIGEVVENRWLAIPTMPRTHGALPALGFAVPASGAWYLRSRAGLVATED